MKEIVFDKQGLIPIVRVEITQAQLGNYTVVLWDKNDENPAIVRDNGSNRDSVEDEFPITRTRAEFEALDGHVLSWVVWIKALNKKPGARYSYTVTVEQGETVAGEDSGGGAVQKALMSFDGDWRISLTDGDA